MGGGTGHPSGKVKKELKRDWLQHVVDTLGSEYGWTKDQTFSMYAREVEILMELIGKRREHERDMRLHDAILAKRVTMAKDAGESFISAIRTKYEMQFGEAEPVTLESIRKEQEMARRMLKRV